MRAREFKRVFKLEERIEEILRYGGDAPDVAVRVQELRGEIDSIIQSNRYYRRRNLAAYREYQQNYRDSHKDKVAAYNKAYQVANRSSLVAFVRGRRYGLTPEQYEVLVLRADGRCESCDILFSETPNIDHSHFTGTVRGLVCRSCNFAIAMLEDGDRVEHARAFLDKYDP